MMLVVFRKKAVFYLIITCFVKEDAFENGVLNVAVIVGFELARLAMNTNLRLRYS